MKTKKRTKNIPFLFALVLVLIGGILLFSKTNSSLEERYTVTYIDVFDTASQFIGYAESEEIFQEQAEILKAELETYHKLYNIYTSYEGINNIRTINQNAGIAPVKVDQKIIDLLKFSMDMYDKTDGQINIAMGSVLSIWHNYRTKGISEPENARLPSMEELEQASLHMDINDIIIDEDASTVYLADSEMSLDVGSIGKGYAVQKVAAYAMELGYDNLIINIGGNAYAIGTRPDGTDWLMGIQNPDLESEQTVLQRVSYSNGCLVTSGDYQRYYTVDGVDYCHIIDPDTLMPADYFHSVSIITDDSGMADALSTALFCMTYEEGVELVNQLEDTEAIWVLKDGSIRYSKHFEDYIVN